MRTKAIIRFLLLSLPLLAAPALASEAGGHEAPLTFMNDWLPRLVNFAVIAAVVVYFGRTPVREFFAGRTASIERSLEESRLARERAATALAEMERKLKEMEAEAARMVADAQARGEKDKQALVAEGQKVAREVQEQVKQGVEIEVQKARAALAAEAALLSLSLAEQGIKDTIGKQDHERIIKDYIGKVGGRG